LNTNIFIMLIGLTGASLTTFAYLPQSIKAIRTKHTKDLSMPMLVMLIFGVTCWVIYGLLLKDIPLIFANSISLIFMLILFFVKKKFG
jgi:MtN3 and saliva related transmembrane protein